METEEIVNRVAGSGIVSLDLEELYHPGKRILYDIKDNLWQGMILREKDFREFLKAHDWAQYQGKNRRLSARRTLLCQPGPICCSQFSSNHYANTICFRRFECIGGQALC
jgi:hypothetical protein